MTHRLAVLISGSGTNLQAIMDAQKAGTLDAEIAVVFSNRANAAGLERAAQAGIPTASLDHRDYPDREQFDQAMIEVLTPYAPDTVVLAGCMRLPPAVFVSALAHVFALIHLPYLLLLHTMICCTGANTMFIKPKCPFPY